MTYARPLLVFRNLFAAYIWAFALSLGLVWLSLVLALLWNGPPAGYSYGGCIGVLLLALLAWAGFSKFVSRRPCTEVVVQTDRRMRVRWFYPFRQRQRELKLPVGVHAELVESVDDENEPYFRARVVLPGGDAVDLAEGHERGVCERECHRFNAALQV
jgi:hypothetical protein